MLYCVGFLRLCIRHSINFQIVVLTEALWAQRQTHSHNRHLSCADNLDDGAQYSQLAKWLFELFQEQCHIGGSVSALGALDT